MISYSKRKSADYDFDDLPPRVIIFILSFHQKYMRPLCDSSEEDFSLFGIFKKDGLRNIWFLYKSIVIAPYKRKNKNMQRGSEGVYYTGFYAGMKRVECFGIQAGSDYEAVVGLLVNSIIKVSPQFLHMERLDFRYCVPHVNFSRLFSSPDNFPRLKAIGITGEWFSLPNILESKAIMGKINSIVQVTGGSDGANFFSNYKEPFERNLTKLVLQYIILGVKLEIELPNLVILSLRYCEGLFVKRCKSLKILSISYMDTKYVEEAMRETTQVRTLGLDYLLQQGTSCRRFIDGKFCPIHRLENLRMIISPQEILDEETVRESWKIFSPRLKKLGIGKRLFDLGLLKDCPYPNIQELAIFGDRSSVICLDFRNLSEILAKNLKKLEITDMAYFSFGEISRIEFPYVEYLMFGNVLENQESFKDVTKEQRVNIFPRLKFLVIYHSSVEGILRSIDFGKIEFLRIQSGYDMSSLRFSQIRFDSLNAVTLFQDFDFFFQKNFFPSVKKICVGKLGEFVGKDWNVSNCEIHTFFEVTEQICAGKQELEAKGVKFVLADHFETGRTYGKVKFECDNN